ncbi:hypothetical protein [Micromonospora sp. NPDC047730]|uniref:hypothetical protein n=1 Tax=Micromonospora sp. NPDC047730 TaxID=3364253 RepID=UPI00371BCF22
MEPRVTAPADDCGVSGGCGACPLAGLCGDPVPGGEQLTIEQALADMPDVDPDEPRPGGVGCCGGGCGG